MRLLARVAHGSGVSRYHEAASRGLGYLVAAQYANGGWPQEYPLRTNYTRRITFNDNAMVNVMTLLDEAAGGGAPWSFVDAITRARARAAVDRGIDATLRTQVRIDGRLTAWCAQHDELTLAPSGARSYEHPSLSGMETVGIVRFLMGRATPADSRLAPAIDAAVAWLDAVALRGLRLDQRPAPSTPRGWDRMLVADPAAPPLWARFLHSAERASLAESPARLRSPEPPEPCGPLPPAAAHRPADGGRSPRSMATLSGQSWAGGAPLCPAAPARPVPLASDRYLLKITLSAEAPSRTRVERRTAGHKDTAAPDSLARLEPPSTKAAPEPTVERAAAPPQPATPPQPAAPPQPAVAWHPAPAPHPAGASRAVLAPLAADRYLLKITPGAEARVRIDRARDLLRHPLRSGDRPPSSSAH